MSGSSSSSSSLARSSAVMASGTLVSRLLGVVRMVLLAAAIGNLNPAANVWETANTIPNTIYLLLAAGVLNVLLLPQLTRAMTRGKEGQDYSDRLITLMITVLVVGTVLFVLAAPLVTKLNMLSFAWDSPELQLAILFAYLCIPQMLFYGLHTLMGQILAAHHRFAAFMWSPALANIIAITGIVAFRRSYPDAATIALEEWTGGMIWLLAGSATLGIVVQSVVLVPAVRATGFTWQPRWGFRGVGLGTAGVMGFWALADVGLSQGGMLVVTNLLNEAMGEVPDAPGRAAYNYAFALFVLPHSLIALSLLTAVYPVLSKAAAADRLRDMAAYTARGLRLLGIAMVPIAIGMLLLAPLLTRVIYLYNTPESQQAIARILVALVFGLVPYGVYLLCARVFYSFEDARTPFLFQVAITSTLLLMSVFAFLAPPTLVAIVLGLGQALGQTVAAVLGLRAVRRRLPWIGLRSVGGTFLRAAAAAVVALLPAWVLIRLLERDGFWGAAVALFVSGVVYLVVYAVLAHLLGVREVAEVLGPVLRRVPGLRGLAPARPVPLVPEVGAEDGDTGTAGDAGGGVPEPTAPSRAGGSIEIPHGEHAVAQPGLTGTEALVWDDAEAASGSGEDSDMDRLEVGTQLGDRYALEELLAQREDGELAYWSARDVTLGRLVAVTALPAGGRHTPVADAALDGARRVASVDDPRLVRVLDVGREDNLCWIVEEGLSEAESLASLVAEQPLPAEEVRRIVGEAAAGLESARRRGLHHLYLNPHSVLRTSDGTVKISGVGVASALEGTDDVTAAEASLIDAADLVSVLYTGLTGRWPGEDLPGVRSARRLADGTLPAPSELVAGVPGDLDALCRIVHGSGADLQRAPHSPGELARQLSPWSSEIVRGARPGELTAPHAGDDDTAGRAASALSGAAGAAAAATAAHPVSSGDDDATAVVPRPYYRTEAADGAVAGAGGGGSRDDADGTAAVGPRRGRGDDDADARGNADDEHDARRRGVAGAGAAGIGASAAARGAAGGGSGGSGSGGGGRGPRDPRGGGRHPSDDDGGLRDDRSGALQTAVIGLVIVGLLALALALGWGVLRGLGGDDESASVDPVVTAEPGQADEAGEDPAQTQEPETEPTEGNGSEEDEGAQETPAADGEPLPILGITSFDPEGDGDENDDLTPLAVDGDLETEWHSHTYLSPGWGSLKSGTGLVLDLGEGAEVSEVEVALGEGEMGATLYLADSPSISDATELGSAEDASDTWTVTAEDAPTGRYLILWFTEAHTSSEGEIVRVREISVR